MKIMLERFYLFSIFRKRERKKWNLCPRFYFSTYQNALYDVGEIRWRIKKKSNCVKSGDLGGQAIIDPANPFRELGIKKITRISFKLG